MVGIAFIGLLYTPSASAGNWDITQDLELTWNSDSSKSEANLNFENDKDLRWSLGVSTPITEVPGLTSVYSFELLDQAYGAIKGGYTWAKLGEEPELDEEGVPQSDPLQRWGLIEAEVDMTVESFEDGLRVPVGAGLELWQVYRSKKKDEGGFSKGYSLTAGFARDWSEDAAAGDSEPVSDTSIVVTGGAVFRWDRSLGKTENNLYAAVAPGFNANINLEDMAVSTYRAEVWGYVLPPIKDKPNARLGVAPTFNWMGGEVSEFELGFLTALTYNAQSAQSTLRY